MSSFVHDIEPDHGKVDPLHDTQSNCNERSRCKEYQQNVDSKAAEYLYHTFRKKFFIASRMQSIFNKVPVDPFLQDLKKKTTSFLKSICIHSLNFQRPNWLRQKTVAYQSISKK